MEPLALYVHWPFCLAKCPYCDFNSHVRERIDQRRFAAALRTELAWEAARLGPRPLGSIFFGGGTPSLMAPETVADIIDAARRLFVATDDIEITLEANPTSVEAGRLAAFAAAGVNRASLGVQSLREESLRLLGRQHDAAQAVAALGLARKTFPRVSFDLIYARPGQTLADWRAELHEALALAADHLSLYQLTIEPGTAFEGLHRRGGIVLPDDDDAAALYDATAEAAARFGLLAYEVSNYARPGAESRHNLAYWRYGDYAGIGPGAHGRLMLGGTLLATRRHRAPEVWAERVERQGHATTHEEVLSPRERAREMLLMGLRLTEGIERTRFAARTGLPLGDAIELRGAGAGGRRRLSRRRSRCAAGDGRGPQAARRTARGSGDLRPGDLRRRAMYQPAHHREVRLEVQHALIRAHPFGLLVTHGPAGLLANAVPFTLAAARGPLGTLRAHLSRANPQWRDIGDGQDALVVFQGEQAYVTPSWYASKREHGRVVPTWNYVMVQARGVVRVRDDRGWVGAQVEQLTTEQESPRAEPWAVEDAPAPFIEGQLRGIVGIEIEVAAIEGKWKASQNRSEADREGVAAGLEPVRPGLAAIVRAG